jgi:hypothetical protein
MTKTKELPKNIETWVTALESGEYDQCSGALYNGEGYCCLGVYAKVVLGYAVEAIIGDEEDDNSYEGPTEIYQEIREDAYIHRGVYDKGMAMNDSGDSSFIDIAKMIREAYT